MFKIRLSTNQRIILATSCIMFALSFMAVFAFSYIWVLKNGPVVVGSVPFETLRTQVRAFFMGMLAYLIYKQIEGKTEHKLGKYFSGDSQDA